MIPLTNLELSGQYVFIVENILPDEHLKFLEQYFTADRLQSAQTQSTTGTSDIRKTDIAWLDYLQIVTRSSKVCKRSALPLELTVFRNCTVRRV